MMSLEKPEKASSTVEDARAGPATPSRSSVATSTEQPLEGEDHDHGDQQGEDEEDGERHGR